MIRAQAKQIDRSGKSSMAGIPWPIALGPQWQPLEGEPVWPHHLGILWGDPGQLPWERLDALQDRKIQKEGKNYVKNAQNWEMKVFVQECWLRCCPSIFPMKELSAPKSQRLLRFEWKTWEIEIFVPVPFFCGPPGLYDFPEKEEAKSSVPVIF